METIRVGLIGFGNWPQEAYAPVLQEMHDVRVVAVAANTEETHALARKTLGDEISVTTDYEKLLEADDIEAVMIALPQGTLIDLFVACEGGDFLPTLKLASVKSRGETGEWREEHSPASEPVYGFEGMRESICDFFTAIRTGRLPRANLEVARRVQHAVHLCVAAGSSSAKPAQTITTQIVSVEPL